MVLYNEDCLEILDELEENSIDAVVTDPPYFIGFMNRKWDILDNKKIGKSENGLFKFTNKWASKVLRILKPGGYLLSACGTRTYHKMAFGIEEAGFEIRDIISYIYGSGFPKNRNIGKDVDKIQNNENKVVDNIHRPEITVGKSEYEGYGTALKPACELWVLARKPLSEKTVAENCLKWGTGAINIDMCRIEGYKQSVPQPSGGSGNIYGFKNGKGRSKKMSDNSKGRHPANLIHDGSEEVEKVFPNTGSGNNKKPYSYKGRQYNNKDTSMFNGDKPEAPSNYNDNGSASRYFYCAKANKKDRNYGCENLYWQKDNSRESGFRPISKEEFGELPKSEKIFGNIHPTVKPFNLMLYLVKLVSPPGEDVVILDPFMGSGNTGRAAIELNKDFIGIERNPDYFSIAKSKIKCAKQNIGLPLEMGPQ